MKVLQICSAVTIGGGETHLLNLVAGLCSLGVEVHVAARPQARWVPNLPPGVPCIRLPLRGAIDLWSAWRLGNWVRKHRVDIVHAHPARDYLVAAFAAKKFASARFVLTRHVHSPISQLALYRRWLRLADAAIVYSARLGSSLGEVFESGRVRFVPAGIDIEWFESARRTLKGDVLRVVVLGQVAPHKGQEEFVHAVELIAPHYLAVQFLIIGDAQPRDSAYLENLRALVKRNRLPRGISSLSRATQQLCWPILTWSWFLPGMSPSGWLSSKRWPRGRQSLPHGLGVQPKS